MNSPFLQIILPVRHDIPDEEAFKSIQSAIRIRFIPPPNRKRILVVAMELFQNLKKHADRGHLSLLKIRKNDWGDYEISSLNFAGPGSSNKLAGKHAELSGMKDYRLNFRNKLQKKIEVIDSPGNLGLDLCFRNSGKSRLRLFPVSDDLSLIYLSFTLNDHDGKISA